MASFPKIKHLKLKYECEICGHKVNSKTSLKTHKNIVHEGIWLRCSEAGCDYKAKDSSTFRFNTSCILVRFPNPLATGSEAGNLTSCILLTLCFRHHKKVVHDGERLVCPHCPLRFTKITSLKRHIKKKHSADITDAE